MNIKVKRKSLTFLVFLAISSVLWLLIKLSKDYTSQTTFTIQFTDVPYDKCISTPTQNVKLAFEADGFQTLAHNLIREEKRKVSISLNEVPYHHEGDITYSFSSHYVAERIADWFKIDVTDITMNDATIYFNLEDLKSKVVPVVLKEDLQVQRQFSRYGMPIITPASVTIYGTAETLSDIHSIGTEILRKQNLTQSFKESVALNLLDGKISCNVQSVEVSIDIEKVTEMDIEIPVKGPDSLDIRFIPDNIKVKCLVAIKDYASSTPDIFSATINPYDIGGKNHLLPVTLTAPSNIQVLHAAPESVEYIIISHEDNWHNW